MRFSLIIPTLNEENKLPACLERVRQLFLLDATLQHNEVIVADGGSTDATQAIARQYGARVCVAQRGRGIQCNAGAAAATGDILIFLYADTLLPPETREVLERCFADPYVWIGTFRLQFDVQHWLLDPAPLVTQADTVFTRFGDQGIVVRRWFFARLGGFPNWPLFEDVRLLEEARFRTKVHSFPAVVTSSARKYMRDGIVENHLMNVWLIMQYLMGVPPDQLARQYWRR
jgi:rSAM/selenodomain-associated transferase 2